MAKKLALLLFLLPSLLFSQVDESTIGGWYMYFFQKQFKEKTLGIQGDIQHRNFKLTEELSQLLVRGGLTYKPKGKKLLLTLGLGNVFVEDYKSKKLKSDEVRIYQELLTPTNISKRLLLKHRIRLELRDIGGKFVRTRIRYALFLTIPLNTSEMQKGSYYLALYNELFYGGFGLYEEAGGYYWDRNRLYGSIGYAISEKSKVQFGIMNQNSRYSNRNQLQLSLHNKF